MLVVWIDLLLVAAVSLRNIIVLVKGNCVTKSHNQYQLSLSSAFISPIRLTYNCLPKYMRSDEDLWWQETWKAQVKPWGWCSIRLTAEISTWSLTNTGLLFKYLLNERSVTFKPCYALLSTSLIQSEYEDISRRVILKYNTSLISAQEPLSFTDNPTLWK